MQLVLKLLMAPFIHLQVSFRDQTYELMLTLWKANWEIKQ